MKGKLIHNERVTVLSSREPTTKYCPLCGKLKKDITLADRVYECSCGYHEDRDVHSAKNMLAIKDFVFQKMNFVPTEHREVTLMEFKASALGSNAYEKAETKK